MPSSSLIKSLAFLEGVQEPHTRDLRGTEPLQTHKEKVQALTSFVTVNADILH